MKTTIISLMRIANELYMYDIIHSKFHHVKIKKIIKLIYQLLVPMAMPIYSYH